jgi:hypothetical protein
MRTMHVDHGGLPAGTSAKIAPPPWPDSRFSEPVYPASNHSRARVEFTGRTAASQATNLRLVLVDIRPIPSLTPIDVIDSTPYRANSVDC